MKPADSRPVPLTLWLLAITAFFTPLLGGSLYVDVTSLAPGPVALFQSIFHGGDTPQAQYLLLTLPLALSLGVLLVRGRVLAMPSQTILSALAIFLGLLALSIFTSVVKVVTIQAVLNWSAYLLAFFAVAASAGRVRGPLVIVAALVAGCGLLAVMGILEWGAAKANDPTWRIFAGWNNPNALAGILIVGFILSLALQVSTEGSPSLLSGLAAVAIGLALFLTQSRGGLLAAFIGVLAFLPVFLKTSAKGGFNSSGFIKTGVTLVACAVLVGMAIFSTRSAAGAAGSRLAGTSATSQSTSFRFLLWKSSGELIKTNPTGTGLNTFGTVSTRPGLTTQTLNGHSTLLELGVEATILAPIALLVTVGLWFWKGVRSPRQEIPMRILGAGVRAAVLAMLIDGLAESNLYFFGTGLVFFMLLGLGLQLSADSVSPEVAPKGFRFGLLGAVCLLLVGAGYFSMVEVMKARARYDRESDQAAFPGDVEALRAIAPGDSESYYLSAFVPTSNPNERLSSLQNAFDLAPSSKIARAIAKTQVTIGKQAAAILSLQKALIDDPNNLLTLSLLLDIMRSTNDFDSADQIAQRMIAIESKPYFKIRSIPELVPLQTALARRYLASRTQDKTRQADLLQGAVNLYLTFADITISNLVDNIKKNGPAYSLPDESPDAAHSHLEDGHEVTAELEAIYRSLGRSKDADAALAAGKTLLDAEGRLADALTSSK